MNKLVVLFGLFASSISLVVEKQTVVEEDDYSEIPIYNDDTGLKVKIHEEGEGSLCSENSIVSLYYIGTL